MKTVPIAHCDVQLQAMDTAQADAERDLELDLAPSCCTKRSSEYY